MSRDTITQYTCDLCGREESLKHKYPKGWCALWIGRRVTETATIQYVSKDVCAECLVALRQETKVLGVVIR